MRKSFCYASYSPPPHWVWSLWPSPFSTFSWLSIFSVLVKIETTKYGILMMKVVFLHSWIRDFSCHLGKFSMKNQTKNLWNFPYVGWAAIPPCFLFKASLRDKDSSVILSERRETDSSKWFLDIFCEESDGFVRNIANMNLILTEFADLEALYCHKTTGNILLQKWKILPSK